MQFKAPMAIATVLMLAACGKGGDSVSMKNASIDEVAKTQTAKIQPGEWEMTMEMVSEETKGGPPNMPAPPKMPPMTNKICITKEQVDNPKGLFGGGMDQMKKDCTYDSFEMNDGKIDSKMHCTMGAIKVVATNTGTFSGTEISSDTTSTVTGLPGGMSTTSHMKMSGKRLGECQPSDIRMPATGGNGAAAANSAAAG
jgi:hypothetical protein